jgi:hypothetical protein
MLWFSKLLRKKLRFQKTSASLWKQLTVTFCFKKKTFKNFAENWAKMAKILIIISTHDLYIYSSWKVCDNYFFCNRSKSCST